MAHQSDVAGQKKRPAEGEHDDQPLAKKFGQLHIGPLGKLHLPENQEGQVRRPQALYGSNDTIMLDDTESTVYIYDLQREFAESEALEKSLSILPGLEDKLSITKLLVPNNTRQCSDVVLYREPESLSIPKDRDQVRRALIETRERARLAQQGFQRGEQQTNSSKFTNQHLEQQMEVEGRQQTNDFGDQMDVDVDN
ncbi:uncharacterized protein BDV17DRAFT_265613 [Aspergillus undulatus]|uniref:uncharacterized protein n=1 Tax=Aspergillus undulatus TaxID=1810928 RepID=UPI003CCDFD51